MYIDVQQLPHACGLALPVYQTPGASGLDLVAAHSTPLELAPGMRALIPTGLIIEVPSRFEAQVRPRSGLALKHGVTVLNAPGTIDSDYRGEIKVLLVNHGAEAYVINRGDRIAQLVFTEITRVWLRDTMPLSPTGRGSGGFGSTGAF